MATTEILPFATGEDAEVMSQADYAALAARTDGFSIGVADPAQLNKVWRQSSFIAAGIANWMVDQDINVPDDGDLSTLVSNISAALTAAILAELGSVSALTYKGVIDCSGNPNYPAASAGDVYVVSVAGKIGGASGINVQVGDMLLCKTTTVSGDQAAVGANWNVVQANIDGAVTGPASSTDGNMVLFNGTSGKIVKDSGIAVTGSGSLAVSGSVSVSGSNTGDQTITLTDDVTGSGTGSFAATVASVGGSTAALVHSAELLANAATSSNTASAIVKRDGSGNFAAGTITATLSGNASTASSAAQLTTSRNIDGQAFNGTANITVIAPGTNAATSKATPVDADEMPLVDSAASNVLKKLTWANLKATLKTYFDTLYLSTTGNKLVYITSVTASGGNVDFTGAVDWTLYDEYVFQLVGLIPSNNAQNLYLRVSIDGSTFLTTAVYDWSVTGVADTGTANSSGGQNEAQFRINQTANGISNATTESINGIIRLFAPNNTARSKNFQWDISYSNGAGNMEGTTGRGRYQGTSAVNGIRFLMDVGDLNSGTVRVYGVRNS